MKNALVIVILLCAGCTNSHQEQEAVAHHQVEVINRLTSKLELMQSELSESDKLIAAQSNELSGIKSVCSVSPDQRAIAISKLENDQQISIFSFINQLHQEGQSKQKNYDDEQYIETVRLMTNRINELETENKAYFVEMYKILDLCKEKPASVAQTAAPREIYTSKTPSIIIPEPDPYLEIEKFETQLRQADALERQADALEDMEFNQTLQRLRHR